MTSILGIIIQIHMSCGHGATINSLHHHGITVDATDKCQMDGSQAANTHGKK
jgi:hypothetical protein